MHCKAQVALIDLTLHWYGYKNSDTLRLSSKLRIGLKETEAQLKNKEVRPDILNPLLHTFRSPKFSSVVKESVKFFAKTPCHSLPPATRFSAGGVYALYYLGRSDFYEHIAALNGGECRQPIYIGKAVLPGWRTARSTTKAEATSLYSRLREHSRNISCCSNLSVSDFQTRFMILQGIESDLVVPIEAELIRKYRPLWNTLIDGFGNHDPGKGRYQQARSEWDILHPGRPWAERLPKSSLNVKDILCKIKRSQQ